MPMTTRSWSLYFFCSSVTCGMAWMHGPHHVAQHSMTYTFPFSNCLTGSPFTHLLTASGGAGSPALSVADFSSCAAALRATAPVNATANSLDSIFVVFMVCHLRRDPRSLRAAVASHAGGRCVRQLNRG